MKQKVGTVLLGLSLLIPAPGVAGDQAGQQRAYGRGLLTCGQVLTMDLKGFMGWVGGFISAANWLIPETYDLGGRAGIDPVMSWVKHYCRLNPDLPLQNAMVAYVRVAMPTRTITAPETLLPPPPERQPSPPIPVRSKKRS